MIEVSAAIITNGTDVLCFQKGLSKRSYLSYKFEFPGGKLEEGETPKQTLIRELKEELDLDTSDCRFKQYRDIIHKYDDFTVLIHYFIIYDYDPKFTLNEHISAVWKPLHLLSELDWAGVDLKAAQILEREGIE